MSRTKGLQIMGYPQLNIQQPVEQQTPGGMTQPDQSLWVWNRTGGLWDPDDHYMFMAQGILQPGESFSQSIRVTCDWETHLCGIWAAGGLRDEFEAKIELSDGHKVVAKNYIQDRTIRGRASIIPPEYRQDSTKLLPVPNSNGGVGIPIIVTWTLTNMGSRKASFSLKGEASLNVEAIHNYYSRLPFPQTESWEGFDPVTRWSSI